jgi:uncharacterized protein YukE
MRKENKNYHISCSAFNSRILDLVEGMSRAGDVVTEEVDVVNVGWLRSWLQKFMMVQWRWSYQMRQLCRAAILTLCMILLSMACVDAQPGKMPKKLIEFGWDMPTPDFVKQNIQQMEKRPFDGIVMTLNAGSNVFLHKPYDPKKFTQDVNNLQATNFSKFTDNFVLMGATTEEGWDWFSESGWKASEQNIRLLAKTARAGRCVGIAFDPEPYGVNPWFYPNLPGAAEKSFQEYWEQVRKRGTQFIQALQQELPGVKVLTLFQLTAFLDEFQDELDSGERMRQLSTAKYGLLPAFLNGILDAAQPNTVIVDGNESAYYYAERKPFFQSYEFMVKRALAFIDPKNRRKYTLQVQAGYATYMDHLFALRQPQEAFLSYYLTPQERAKWFEHNTYYAFLTSDEYVWCYSERINWWENKVPAEAGETIRSAKVPVGAEEAIRSARKKIESGQPLGFNIGKMTQTAENRCKNLLKKRPGFLNMCSQVYRSLENSLT